MRKPRIARRLWIAAAVGFAVVFVAGGFWFGWTRTFDGLDRWQTLMTGAIALGIGWLTVRGIDRQIAEAKVDQEISRRAMIAGQNQLVIDRLNKIGTDLALLRDRISARPTSNLGIARGLLSDFEDYEARGFDIDSVDAFYRTRSAVVTAVKRYEHQMILGDDVGAAKTKALKATSDMTAVLRSMVRLLGQGRTLHELSAMTPDGLHREASALRPDKGRKILRNKFMGRGFH